MTEQGNTKGDPTPAAGVYLVGGFLGIKTARTFERRDTKEVVNVKPRIGLMIGDEEVEIVAADDTQARSLTGRFVRGQVVQVRVDVRPPYGARGAVQFTVPGLASRERETWQ